MKGSWDIAQKSMIATDKLLAKRGNWDTVHQSQIEDILVGGVIRKIPMEELVSSKGHINYLSHLAVQNPRYLV